MVHQAERDPWLLIVEEVVRLHFLLTTVKRGKFFTAILVDALGVLDSVRTLQATIKLLLLKYLRIQKPERLCFPGKCLFFCCCCYITIGGIMIA
jgi:hypothetical protein